MTIRTVRNLITLATELPAVQVENRRNVPERELYDCRLQPGDRIGNLRSGRFSEPDPLDHPGEMVQLVVFDQVIEADPGGYGLLATYRAFPDAVEAAIGRPLVRTRNEWGLVDYA